MSAFATTERALKRVEQLGFGLIKEDRPVYEQAEGKDILNTLFWTTGGAFGFQYTDKQPR
jgi:hypothetical protein